MPRYFFDIHDGAEAHDTIGAELADPEAARLRALQVASTYATAPERLETDGGAIVVRVRGGEAARHLLTVRLVVSVEAEPGLDGDGGYDRAGTGRPSGVEPLARSSAAGASPPLR